MAPPLDPLRVVMRQLVRMKRADEEADDDDVEPTATVASVKESAGKAAKAAAKSIKEALTTAASAGKYLLRYPIPTTLTFASSNFYVLIKFAIMLYGLKISSVPFQKIINHFNFLKI